MDQSVWGPPLFFLGLGLLFICLALTRLICRMTTAKYPQEGDDVPAVRIRMGDR